MSYVNILIKNGLIGYASYILIFKDFLSGCKRCTAIDQSIVKSLVIVLLISGLTETYAVSIHYVVGPVMYCLIRGLIYQDRGVYIRDEF